MTRNILTRCSDENNREKCEKLNNPAQNRKILEFRGRSLSQGERFEVIYGPHPTVNALARASLSLRLKLNAHFS